MDACRTHETTWKDRGHLITHRTIKNQNKAFFTNHSMSSKTNTRQYDGIWICRKVVLDRLDRQCRLYSRWLQNGYKVCSRHNLHKGARFLLCHPSWGARITSVPNPKKGCYRKEQVYCNKRKMELNSIERKGTRVFKCCSRLVEKSTTRHYPGGGKMMRSAVLVNWHIYKSAFYPSTETGGARHLTFWWFHFKGPFLGPWERWL